jgi:hypothetical protein
MAFLRLVGDEGDASSPSILRIARETIEGRRRNKSQETRTGRETGTATVDDLTD